LGNTGIAALLCSTNLKGYNGKSHLDLPQLSYRQKGLSFTSGNTGKIPAKITRDFIGKNHWGFIHFSISDTSIGASTYTIPTARTPVKKKRFFDGSRRTQPVRTDRHCFLLLGRRSITVLHIFLNSHPQRNN